MKCHINTYKMNIFPLCVFRHRNILRNLIMSEIDWQFEYPLKDYSDGKSRYSIRRNVRHNVLGARTCKVWLGYVMFYICMYTASVARESTKLYDVDRGYGYGIILYPNVYHNLPHGPRKNHSVTTRVCVCGVSTPAVVGPVVLLSTSTCILTQWNIVFLSRRRFLLFLTRVQFEVRECRPVSSSTVRIYMCSISSRSIGLAVVVFSIAYMCVRA